MVASFFFAYAVFAAAADPVCDAPGGMACVNAGSVAVGEGDDARTVDVAAFYVDSRAVSVDDTAACVKAGTCTAVKRPKDGKLRVDWNEADRVCAFFGKRLPSEAEWTAAHVDNAEDEWTATWFVKPKSCTEKSAPIPQASKVTQMPPALCGKIDPLDACDGAVLCGTLSDRVTKSSSKPAARARGIANAAAGAVARSFRCVSSTANLPTYPSKWTSKPKTPPPELSAPTAEQQKLFANVTPDVLEVPPCEKAGRSFIDCRDPRSYLKTNEPHLDVVVPYVLNQGGGYTGVASDQNYTLIALARSQWAWLFDYDANVVTWHHVLLALISASPDRNAFVAAFANVKDKAVIASIEEAAVGLGEDPKALVAFFRASGPPLHRYYEKQLSQEFTWLGSDAHYAWIKTMVAQKRNIAIRGNMLDKNAMTSIGAACKALGVPMRIYYPSNAPEFWVFSDQYRANVAALPFDDETIVVQTISGLKSGFNQQGYWHYNIQWGREQQQLLALPGYTRLKQLLHHRIRGESGDITLSGLPAR